MPLQYAAVERRSCAMTATAVASAAAGRDGVAQSAVAGCFCRSGLRVAQAKPQICQGARAGNRRVRVTVLGRLDRW